MGLYVNNGINSVVPFGAGIGPTLPSALNSSRSMTAAEGDRFFRRHEQPLVPSPADSTKKGFSVTNALKSLGKGFLHPLHTLVKHPVKSALAIGGILLLASQAPVLIPLIVMIGLGLGLKHIASGSYEAIQEYRNGNYEASEKAFEHIGEGVFAIGASLLGVRHSGAVVAQGKASAGAFKAGASAADKAKAMEAGVKAADKVHHGSWLNALKETSSVLSPKGLRVAGNQLGPKHLLTGLGDKFRSLPQAFRNGIKGDSVIHSAEFRVALEHIRPSAGLRQGEILELLPGIREIHRD